MAVWIYKDEESQLVEPEYLDGMINAGWSVGDGKEESVEEKPDEDLEDQILEEWKEKAKQAGIKGWQVMSTETLKKRLIESGIEI